MGVVKRSDISEADLLGGIRDSAKSALNEVDRLNKELVETAKITKAVASAQKFDSTESLKKTTDAQKASNELKKEAIRLQQEEEKLRKIVAQADIASLSAKEKERAITERQLKNSKDKSSAYKQESARLNELRNKYKDLAVQNQANSKEARTLLKEITSLDKGLKRIDKTVGQSQREVGNYGKAWNGLRNTLGQVGLAFSGIQIFGKVEKTLQAFDEGAADVAKTTGLTTEKARELSKELLKFDTKTTISELQGLTAAAGSLNVEGTDNILGFVESADKAFVALGDDLGGTSQEIATNVGKIAGVFGDEKTWGIGPAINKIGSSINELAGKSKAAAAPILDFTQRMAGLGNLISSADANALGAFFDEGGQSVEVASTTLNTLLPQMASNYKKFAETAGMSAEEFKKLAEESPIEALKAVANGAKNSEKGLFNLAKTVEGFGVESARATSIVGFLANNTDRLTELQKISNDAYRDGTSLTDEFNKKNQTLGANWDKLKNSLDAYIIGVDSSTGATGGISKALGFLATNLSTVISTTLKLVAVFGIYKGVQKALKLREGILDWKNQSKAIATTTTELNKNTTAQKGATSAASGLKGALISIGWTAVIALASEFAIELYRIASGAKQAEEDLARFNKATEASAKSVSKNLEKIQKNEALRTAELNRKLKVDLANAKSDKERNNIQKEYNKKIEEEIQLSKTQLRNSKDKVLARRAEYKQSLRILETLEKEINNSASKGDTEKVAKLYEQQKKFLKETSEKYKIKGDEETAFGLKTGGENIPLNYADAVAQLKANISATGVSIREYGNALIQSNESLKDATTESESYTKSSEKEKEARKALNTELEITNEYLSRAKELDQELTEQMHANDISEIQREINDELERQNFLAEETGDFDSAKLNELLKKKFELEKANIDQIARYQLSSIDARIKAEKQAEIDALNDKYNELLAQEGLIQSERDKIQENYNNELKVISDNDVKRVDDAEKEKALIRGKAVEDQKELIISSNDEIESSNEGLASSQESFLASLQKDIEEKTRNHDAERELVKMLADYYIEQSNRRIAQIEKEQNAAQKQYDALAEMAKNGTITAKESLAEQQEAINEAEKKKIRELKRQERIKLAQTAYDTYSAKLDSGDKMPLVNTIKDITLLQAFISSLPAFKDGGTHDGGLMLVNDAVGDKFREIIQTPDGKLSSPTGRNVVMNAPKGTNIYTQDQFAEIARDIRSRNAMSRINPNTDTSGNTLDILPMLNELKGVKKAIQSMPDIEGTIKRLGKGMVELTTTRRTLSGTIINRNIIRDK